ncbi:hypothetical protein KVE29_00135 [Helicobacter pylori]|uniref:hypothetical protein n=1 Tax=Helicobacter pylori TaxID=210 RepID=UPI003087DA1B|nr:hypothetical protein KVE29_00135 [Helicobacter pylori]
MLIYKSVPLNLKSLGVSFISGFVLDFWGVFWLVEHANAKDVWGFLFGWFKRIA